MDLGPAHSSTTSTGSGSGWAPSTAGDCSLRTTSDPARAPAAGQQIGRWDNSYALPVIKLLFATARTCAYPDCAIPLVFIEEERDVREIAVQIAHIRSPEGQRASSRPGLPARQAQQRRKPPAALRRPPPPRRPERLQVLHRGAPCLEERPRPPKAAASPSRTTTSWASRPAGGLARRAGPGHPAPDGGGSEAAGHRAGPAPP